MSDLYISTGPDSGTLSESQRTALREKGLLVKQLIAQGGEKSVYLGIDTRDSLGDVACCHLVALKVRPVDESEGKFAELDLLGARHEEAIIKSLRDPLDDRSFRIPDLLPSVEIPGAHVSVERLIGRVAESENFPDIKTFDDLLYDLWQGGSGLSVQKRAAQFAQCLDVFKQVLDVVSYCHGKGVAHLDLKPGNVIVVKMKDGDYKAFLIDFGLAKRVDSESAGVVGAQLGTRTRASIGESRPNERVRIDFERGKDVMHTEAYCAPEQLSTNRGELGFKTDVYCLGATLYQLLTGRTRFEEIENPTDWEGAVVNRTPETPNGVRSWFSRNLALIASKSMAVQQGLRYESVAEMLTDIEHYQENRPIRANPTRRNRLWMYLRRNPAVVPFLMLASLGFGSRYIETETGESDVVQKRRVLGDNILVSGLRSLNAEAISECLSDLQLAEEVFEKIGDKEKRTLCQRKLEVVKTLIGFSESGHFDARGEEASFLRKLQDPQSSVPATAAERRQVLEGLPGLEAVFQERVYKELDRNLRLWDSFVARAQVLRYERFIDSMGSIIKLGGENSEVSVLEEEALNALTKLVDEARFRLLFTWLQRIERGMVSEMPENLFSYLTTRYESGEASAVEVVLLRSAATLMNKEDEFESELFWENPGPDGLDTDSVVKLGLIYYYILHQNEDAECCFREALAKDKLNYSALYGRYQVQRAVGK